jgi:hypothetical protein
VPRRDTRRRLLREPRRAADVRRRDSAVGIGPIPVAIVPVAPAVDAAEILAVAEGAVVVERADAQRLHPVPAIERNPHIALAVVDSEPAIVAAAILDPEVAVVAALVLDANVAIVPATVGDADVAMAIPTLFDAVRLSAVLGLEVGEALAATALDALCLSLATALDLSDALALAATAFGALRLASALGTRHAMLTAAALRLCPAAPMRDRALSAATALRLGLTLAAAALRLGL